MVKNDGNIDLVFRDGLKDMELLPPADVWNSISPAIGPSGTRSIFFRVAAGIAALVSLGLLSYFIGVRTTDSMLGPLIADAGNIEVDNSFMEVAEPIIFTEAPGERAMSNVIIANAADVQKELISPVLDNVIRTQTGNYDIGRSDRDEAPSGLHLTQAQDPGFNTFNNTAIIATATEDLSPQSHKWKLGAKMSPTYLSTNLKAANNSFGANADNESAAISYTGGISVSYSMGGRLSLQTGVYYSSLARQISGIDSYSGFAGLTQTKGDKIFGVETSAGEIASTNNDIYLSDANSNRISSIGSVESFDPQKANLEPYGSALRQNFEYLEVPLILSYKLIDKKVDFNISGGLAYNFLLGNSTYAVSEGSKIEIGSTEDLQPLLLSSAFAMSMEYALNDKFSFNIEPSLRYYLNSDGSLMSNNPFTFGFFSGLYFKF